MEVIIRLGDLQWSSSNVELISELVAVIVDLHGDEVLDVLDIEEDTDDEPSAVVECPALSTSDLLSASL